MAIIDNRENKVYASLDEMKMHKSGRISVAHLLGREKPGDGQGMAVCYLPESTAAADDISIFQPEGETHGRWVALSNS